jgi:hypothetical protein
MGRQGRIPGFGPWTHLLPVAEAVEGPRDTTTVQIIDVPLVAEFAATEVSPVTSGGIMQPVFPPVAHNPWETKTAHELSASVSDEALRPAPLRLPARQASTRAPPQELSASISHQHLRPAIIASASATEDCADTRVEVPGNPTCVPIRENVERKAALSDWGRDQVQLDEVPELEPPRLDFSGRDSQPSLQTHEIVSRNDEETPPAPSPTTSEIAELDVATEEVAPGEMPLPSSAPSVPSTALARKEDDNFFLEEAHHGEPRSREIVYLFGTSRIEAVAPVYRIPISGTSSDYPTLSPTLEPLLKQISVWDWCSVPDLSLMDFGNA